MSGLVTKTNEDDDWARKLSEVTLWEDVSGVGEIMEQRKFKE